MMRSMKLSIPLLILIGLSVVLWRGLSLDPHLVPSPLINKALPDFKLKELGSQKTLTKADLVGQVFLLNSWASWCEACQEEHPFLLSLKDKFGVRMIGYDYKDNPRDASDWLKASGSPYQHVLVDEKGLYGLELGLYGVPETLLIDKKGMIRYKVTGVLTESIWTQTLMPLIQTIENEK